MKKTYSKPEWEIMQLIQEDILTASGDTGGSVSDPYGEDKDWNLTI